LDDASISCCIDILICSKDGVAVSEQEATETGIQEQLATRLQYAQTCSSFVSFPD